MRIKLLFYFFIISISTQGQTSVYHPFPDSNAVWNVRWCCGLFPYMETNSYILNGDTVIGSNVFHQLLIPFVDRQGDTTAFSALHPTGYAGCVRQEIANKKVFYVAPGDTLQQLLYDFNMQVGDTIPGFTRFTCVHTTDTIIAIDSVLIGGNYRKRWRLSSASGFSAIIEGIGRTTGLLEGCPSMTMLDMPGFSLDCFTQNDLPLFPNDSAVCNTITAINNMTGENYVFTLSPNPATKELRIQNADLPAGQAGLRIEKIEIYNTLGEKIFSQKPDASSQQQLVINVSEWSNGIYFVKVKTSERQQTQKLIVQH